MNRRRGASSASRRGTIAAMLYGRDAERSLIGELLDGARQSRSGVLVLRGDAGVGKSALLRDARERAADMQVLSGCGTETEAQLPFAALDQIVRPIVGLAENLPEPQARALRGALGLEASGGSDRFLVSLAVLSLLAEAAERQPLLCLVDDAQWLDEASVDALVFAARRLEAEGIVMLFAVRELEGRRFEAAALPELRLEGLDADAAEALVDGQVGVQLSPEARQRLIDGTGGNPLALLELPSFGDEALLAGAEALFAPLPVSGRVERAFLTRVRRLPQETQTVLLVAAAEDSGELATVLSAATQLGVPADALDAAERAGLARVRGTKVELHHPLVRSSVYQGAPLSRRRAAHRAIASVLEGDSAADRRAWHRAAASLEPDPSVVDELDRVAQRARERSGFLAASLAFERAAALTPDGPQLGRRLIAAAENAWSGGRLERAHMLLARARPLAPGPVELADIDLYRGLIEMTVGVPADACQLLLDAAADVAPLDSKRALELLNLASVAGTYAGDAAASMAIAKLADGLTVEDTPIARMLVDLLVGLGAHFGGDFATAAARLRSALEIEEEREIDALTDQPMALISAGRAAILLGDDQAHARLHREAAAQARAAGLLGLLTQVLPRLGYAELWEGRWHSASATLSEGVRLARETGQHDLVAHQLVLLALIAAHRGAEEQCRSLAAEGIELAAARGFALATDTANWALTLLELGLGRAAEAYPRAREISAVGVEFCAPLDRIEVAIGAGEHETARGWLASFESWAMGTGAAWAGAVVLHCRALLAADDHASEELFRAALEAHGQAARPFERARTELAFGEALRRARRRVDAREHLHAALSGFEALGAELWAERARVELRASGQTARRRTPSTRDELTAQELQIARFVAQGLTNREAASQLFLSPRTIAFHLRNIFRKLDISSRTQLARLDLDSVSAKSAPAADQAIRPVRP